MKYLFSAWERDGMQPWLVGGAKQSSHLAWYVIKDILLSGEHSQPTPLEITATIQINPALNNKL